MKLEHGKSAQFACNSIFNQLERAGKLAIVQASWTIPFHGLWETPPLEAVHLDHLASPCALNK